MAAVDGKALADYATDRFGTFMPAHLYAWGYGQMSSLLSYLIALCVKIGGLNIITTRLPLLAVSLLGILFFYLLMRDTFGEETGLIAALFAAVNPWHFMQSRWSVDCNLLPHFFIGGMFFLSRSLDARKGKKTGFLFLSMLFFGLCMYSYGVSLYTIPPLLFVMALYYLIKKKMKVREVLFCIIVYLLIAWPFLLTMAVNLLKWRTITLPFVTIPYFPDSVRSEDILFFSDHIPHQMILNIRSIIRTVLLQKSDYLGNSIPKFGTMHLYSIPFLVAGIAEFLRRTPESGKNKSILSFTLAGGIWVGVFTNNINTNRINLIYYGLMAFVVLGIVFTVKEIPFFRWIHIFSYGALTFLFLCAYFGDYADAIGEKFYAGFGDAFISAENADTETIYITSYTQSRGSSTVSEILTLFYDKTDAEYFQGKTNVNHGKQLLPYKKRFQYVEISDNLEKRKDAAYVVRTEETEYFNTKKFNITTFGKYSAVVPKQ